MMCNFLELSRLSRYLLNKLLVIISLSIILCYQVAYSDNITRDEFLKNTVILGIYGFLGDSEGGVAEIINSIKHELVRKGVPSGNIKARSWNSDANDNPSSAPNLQKLSDWVIEHGTENPSFYVIIGHSYGGWAAAKLSDHSPLREPDMLFTIDPVLGPSNHSNVNPKAKDIRINWRQTIAVMEIPLDAQCLGVDGGACHISLNGQPVSACGANMPNMDNRIHDFVHGGDCEVKRRCGILNKKWRTAHVKIDEDACIREQIRTFVIDNFSQKFQSIGNL